MEHRITSFSVLCLMTLCLSALALADYPRRPMLSQRAIVAQTIGLTDITVTYHRPHVKGREIWGTIVPYNAVWRAGANEATTIEFTDDVTMGGTAVEAGIYSLFIIPHKDGAWTLVLNTDATQWGAFRYDSTKNVLALDVQPQEAPHEEELSYSFSNLTWNSCTLTLRWEKLALPFTINADTDAKLAALDEEAVTAAWQQLHSTAHTYYEQGINWEAAMAAIDKSIAIDENDANLWTKAQLLAQAGKKREAIEIARRTIIVGKQRNPTFDSSLVERFIEEWKK